jgi:hypothetical protein
MAALALSAGGAAMADTVVFSDNFNAENGGVGVLNYGGFANWSVSDGTVDLIGNGYFQLGMPVANGLFVDLDGSTHNAGVLTSDPINFIIGYTYKLEFDIAGNQRGSANDTVAINVSVNALSDTLTLASSDPLTHITYYFTATATPGALSFANAGGDNIGALLDNVTVTLVPAPQAAGLGLLGSRRRIAKLVKRA